MQEIARQSEWQYKLGPGTLYDNLKKLMLQGLIEETAARSRRMTREGATTGSRGWDAMCFRWKWNGWKACPVMLDGICAPSNQGGPNGSFTSLVFFLPLPPPACTHLPLKRSLATRCCGSSTKLRSGKASLTPICRRPPIVGATVDGSVRASQIVDWRSHSLVLASLGA